MTNGLPNGYDSCGFSLLIEVMKILPKSISTQTDTQRGTQTQREREREKKKKKKKEKEKLVTES